jgi:phosphoglycolate phosphatase
MKRKLIIFDYDGVIVDSALLWEETMNQLRGKYRLEAVISTDDFIAMDNLDKQGMIDLAGITDSETGNSYIDEVFYILENRYQDYKLFDGIGELMKKLWEKGHILCINSAGKGAIAEKILKENGIYKYFSVIIGGDYPGTKSDKIKILRRKYRKSKKTTYMVGDSLLDVIHGKKAKVKTVMVSYGWQNRGILEAMNPDCLCDTVDELSDVLVNI